MKTSILFLFEDEVQFSCCLLQSDLSTDRPVFSFVLSNFYTLLQLTYLLYSFFVLPSLSIVFFYYLLVSAGDKILLATWRTVDKLLSERFGGTFWTLFGRKGSDKGGYDPSSYFTDRGLK